MSDAPSRVHRNAQTALQGSSAAAALGPRCDRATLKARLANPLSPLSYTVITTANPPTRCGCSSGVEHNLAKVGVGGSNPLARSKLSSANQSLTKRTAKAVFFIFAGGQHPVNTRAAVLTLQI